MIYEAIKSSTDTIPESNISKHQIHDNVVHIDTSKNVKETIKWVNLITYSQRYGIHVVGLIILTYIIYNNFFYNKEMNQIRDRLNELENVEVINIWGHEDITLEEITARLKIGNKGEIVLYGLSKDAFNYPKSVSVSEIGGYSFTWFSCNGGIGSNINIGQESEIGRRIGIQFYSVSDVVENYDKILNVIVSLKQSPDLNHFTSANSESYLLVERKNSKDQDPIFNLLGIKNKFEFAKTLKWTREDCYYNN